MSIDLCVLQPAKASFSGIVCLLLRNFEVCFHLAVLLKFLTITLSCRDLAHFGHKILICCYYVFNIVDFY